MHDPPSEKLPSLSETSPINHLPNTDEPIPSLSTISQPTRKHTKSDAQARERRLTAVRAAKREVLANVKEDWTWPPPPTAQTDSFPRRRKSTRWRERESDSSPVTSRSPSPSPQDPYKFESPDALAPLLESRKSKRRKLTDDEAEWNEGLRVFTGRRDWWTGAEHRPASPGHDQNGRHDRSGEGSLGPPTIDPSIPQSKVLYDDGRSPTRPKTSANNDSPPSSPHSPTTSSTTTPPSSTRTSRASDLIPPPTAPLTQQITTATTTTFVPLAPPLLHPRDHPHLTPITPSLYPSIYTKCVAQGQAPSVPVNLAHVLRSLVQGWKTDGDWPPKISGIGGVGEGEGEAVKRKEGSGSLRGRMRRLGVGVGVGDELEEQQGGVERVVGKGVRGVRKVLGR
ncbi:MAG: hypothetical protein Q9220_006619 [cf. Caloplaca sp. 1 TL-2023]